MEEEEEEQEGEELVAEQCASVDASSHEAVSRSVGKAQADPRAGRSRACPAGFIAGSLHLSSVSHTLGGGTRLCGPGWPTLAGALLPQPPGAGIADVSPTPRGSEPVTRMRFQVLT